MATTRRRPRRRSPGTGQVRLLPSGRWQVRYVEPDGRLRPAPMTFGARIDADSWLARWAAGEIDPDEVSPATVTDPRLRVYADQWLADRPLKPRTRALYRSILDRTILPALGEVPLSRVTTARVRAWHAGLPADHPTQRAHAYALLRTIMGTAVDDEIVAANPCRIRAAGSVRAAHEVRVATPPELSVLVAAMPERLRPMVLLAAWCGLRFGELTELRRGDVDMTTGVVHVRRGVVRVGPEYVVGTPKSAAGRRSVAMPDHVAGAVVAHLASPHVGPGDDALLFPAVHGGHMAPSTLYGPFYAARKKAKRPDLRFHDLRHTGATLAAATGATLADVMARLGHSTPGAAMRYQHASGDRDRAIADALSGFAAASTVPLTPRTPSRRQR